MHRVILTLAAVLLAGCAHDLDTPLAAAPRVVTLVNLHPDPNRQLLYSVNYLQRGLIPMCTEVRFVSVRSDQAVFRVVGSGEEYRYVFHGSLSEPKEEHLARHFGPRCEAERVKALSKADRDGIRAGDARVGMTKQGVIFAVGPPPSHATPNLESDQWRYWTSRFNTILVEFDGGRVARIVN